MKYNFKVKGPDRIWSQKWISYSYKDFMLLNQMSISSASVLPIFWWPNVFFISKSA